MSRGRSNGNDGNVLGVRCVRMGFKGNALGGILHQDVSRGGSMVMSWGCPTSRCVQRGFNGNVLRGCPTSRCVQRGFNGNVLRGYPTSGCVQRGFNGNVQGSMSRGGPK